MWHPATRVENMATWGTWSDASNGGQPTCRDQSCDICISPWVCHNDSYACYNIYNINIGGGSLRCKNCLQCDKNLLKWMLILEGSHITKPPSKAVTSPVVSFVKALSVTNLWKRKVRYTNRLARGQVSCHDVYTSNSGGPLRSSTTQPPSKVRMALSPNRFEA